MNSISPTITMFLALIAASAALAQNAVIQGVVADSSGAVIPAATVTVTNLETGVVLQATTNAVGLYTVPSLHPGRYKIGCWMTGFAPQERPEIRIEVAQTARVDFNLGLGTVTEVVEVSAAASLIQSEKTDVGQVIDSKRILEMPLNGRNYLQLAQFAVGVLPGGQAGKGIRTRDAGGFVAVGTHGYQNTVLLDGADNSSVAGGGPLGEETQAATPPVDAIAEFKVVTNNTSAEYGYKVGGKVLVSTKSGTNAFHGSLYEFLRNDRLDGTNFFANRAGAAKPPYRQNQFGGTLGGPILKNRTFFFSSFQGTRIRLGESYTSSVPSREVKNGNFSNQPATRRNIFDPATLTGSGANAVRNPFPGNIIPASRFDPVSKTVMNLYPDPNISGREDLPSNYFFSPSDTDDADQYDFRVDHNFTESHRMFARYSIRNEERFNPGPLPLPADGGSGVMTRFDSDTLAANYNVTISPVMYNELRFGWTHFPTAYDVPFKENLNQKYGIKGAPLETMGKLTGFTMFSPSGFTNIGTHNGRPNVNNLDNLLSAESLMFQKGRHSIKFGAEFRRQNQFREVVKATRGQFQFNGVYTAEKPNVAASRSATGNPLADMLMGWPNNVRLGTLMGENIVVPYYGFFIQDDWKITPRLTLNMGLRWELFQAPYFPNAEKQGVSRLLTAVNGVSLEQEKLVEPKDGRDSGAIEDFNNFAPRLGLAYRLRENTVIRAGAGIYYGEPDASGMQSCRFSSGPPKQFNLTLAQPRETTEVLVRQGFPALPAGLVPEGVGVNTYPYFLPTLYVSQWFFDVQQTLPWDTLLTIGYNGSASSHLGGTREINAPLTPHATIRWQDRAIRPQWSSVTLHDHMLNASYESLTVKAEKRFSRGFTFLNSFTWAHNLDYDPEHMSDGGSGAASPYNFSRERASSDLDRRLGYSLSFLYELPFGRGKTWLRSGAARWVLGGWEVGGILSLSSGMPFDHSFNVDNQNNAGKVRGDWLRGPNLPASERTIDRWFDTGFVTASAPGVIANAGRNLIIGPGRSNFDFVLSKEFDLPREGHRLQFRFESFNLTNSPQFAGPNVAVGTPSAGMITRAEEPRRIQFALKYVF